MLHTSGPGGYSWPVWSGNVSLAERDRPQRIEGESSGSSTLGDRFQADGLGSHSPPIRRSLLPRLRATGFIGLGAENPPPPTAQGAVSGLREKFPPDKDHAQSLENSGFGDIAPNMPHRPRRPGSFPNPESQPAGVEGETIPTDGHGPRHTPTNADAFGRKRSSNRVRCPDGDSIFRKRRTPRPSSVGLNPVSSSRRLSFPRMMVADPHR